MRNGTAQGGLKKAAKKSLGQNFLVNPGIAPKMVAASGIDRRFGVLEIGPGHGALTKELIKAAGKVVAIEIDGDLIPELKATFSKAKNFSLIEGDALKLDLKRIIADAFSGMPVAVIGNLPYYITSPIIMKLLEERLPVEMVVAMVQKEAAERLTAREGSREAGAVTLAVRYYSEPSILFPVSPGSFWPIPKVSSAVIKLEIRRTPAVHPHDEKWMFLVIKAAFSQRRKTAVNAISASLSIPKERVMSVFSDCGIDAMLRPERLTLADFALLSDSLM